jgi:hypothetical protein
MSKVTVKPYRCSQCGYISKQLTNHNTENTWSVGHINCCPDCPPHAKYPEFGGRTIWIPTQKEFIVTKVASTGPAVKVKAFHIWADSHGEAGLAGALQLGMIKCGSARNWAAPRGTLTIQADIHDFQGAKVGTVLVEQQDTIHTKK